MTRHLMTAPPLLRDPLLVVYLALALAVLLPARLIVAPLGGLGAPATIVMLGAVLLYLFAMLRQGTLAAGFQPIRFALVMFWTVMLFGYAVGLTKPHPGVLEAASMRTLILLTGFVAVGLLIADTVRNRDHLDRLLSLVVMGASVVAVLGIVQFIAGVAPAEYIRVPGLALQEVEISIERSIFTRVQGTTLHPIEFGVLLATVLPLALHQALHGVRGRSPSLWRWLPVGLILVASPMAVSRSSVLGIMVGAGLLALTWSGRLRLATAAGAAVLLLAMRSAFPGLLGTLRSMFVYAGDDPSIEGRTEDFPLVLEYFRDDPWFGRGLGTFIPSEFFYLDNQYFGTLLTTGLLGLAALVLLFVVAISTGRGVYHHATDPSARSLGQALAASTAVAAVTWATYDGLGFRIGALFTFVLIGATGALWRLEVGGLRWGEGVNRRRPEVPPRRRRADRRREAASVPNAG